MTTVGSNCCGSYSEFLISNPLIGSFLKIPDEYHDKCHVCLANCDPSKANSFRVVLRLTLTSIEEIHLFLKSLTKESYVTWRTTRCDSCMSSGRKNLFWRTYHCQNSNAKLNSKTKKPHLKRTGCTARLSVTLKRIPKRTRSLDPHMPNFPTKLEFVNCHNHQLFNADYLKFRDVDPEVEVKFKKLFQNGFTPTAALILHKYDLQALYKRDYHLYVTDPCYCPSLQWCCRTYYKCLKSQMISKEVATEKTLNSKMKDYPNCIKYEIQEEHFCIAVVSPFMRRVHKYLPAAAKIVFVDAFQTNNKNNYRVYILLANSQVCGLPLGILITQSEDQQQLMNSLGLYKSLLNEESFGGRGAKGAQAFVIENSVAERESLTLSFPESQVYLCVSHLLKLFWQYLWDERNSIEEQDRVTLFGLVRKIVFSSNEADLVDAYVSAQINTVASKYEEFLNYLCRLWDQRTLWAAPYLPGSYPDFITAPIDVFREKILQRLRSYSIVQLIEFIFSRLDAHYERKLQQILHNTFENEFINFDEVDVSEFDVNNTGKMYQVRHKGQSTAYQVDSEVQLCSCDIGVEGFLCQHLCLIPQPEISLVEHEETCHILRLLLNEIQNEQLGASESDDDESNFDEDIFNSLIDGVVRPLATKAAGNKNLKSAIDVFRNSFENIKSDDDLVEALTKFGTCINKGNDSTAFSNLQFPVSKSRYRRILPKQDTIVKSQDQTLDITLNNDLQSNFITVIDHDYCS